MNVFSTTCEYLAIRSSHFIIIIIISLNKELNLFNLFNKSKVCREMSTKYNYSNIWKKITATSKKLTLLFSPPEPASGLAGQPAAVRRPPPASKTNFLGH